MSPNYVGCGDVRGYCFGGVEVLIWCERCVICSFFNFTDTNYHDMLSLYMLSDAVAISRGVLLCAKSTDEAK
jgi:hypothetical protein